MRSGNGTNENGGANMEKLRVLIADDEALIRLDVREMLIDAGHTVVAEAKNGDDAIRFVRELKPDFVIMDVKMPGSDGINASKVIVDEQLAPVLLLTAYSQEDIVSKANDAGVLAYLVKPVREEQLFPAMEVAYARFKDIRALGLELESLKSSLETRKLLDRAKGILMDAHGFTEAEAYRKMQQYSMNQRITIKQLAEAIISAAAKKK
ncbi:putative transcriptional regulatory protein pdtaR [bioreactor metagenome]|uniref:Putative transcriptional regulatory protein pdtaR n=1 Tax=bioreactor metagenome TaxID=1076179 RepID=A0A644WSY9_9ZZZZ